MRLKQYLNEEYLTRIKGIGGSTEVFIDPSRRDLRDLSELIRIIADNRSKSIYVWDATKALHKEVWRQIKGKDSRLEIDPTLLAATGTKKGNMYHIFPEYGEQNPKDFKWIKEYGMIIRNE